VAGRLLYAAQGHIWLYTGTTARRLTGPTPALQPAWSPDGKEIAFVVRGEGYSDIWVMEADGSNPHPVTVNRSTYPEGSHEAAHTAYWAFQPQWIPPEGDWIGYISHYEPRQLSNPLSVWRIRPDGSGEQPYLSLGGFIETPTWSPDGQYMAFAFFTYDHRAQLRYLDLNTGKVLRLGKDEEGIERYDPAWSPDGRWIAYAARQGGATQIWVMPSPLNPLYQEEWAPRLLSSQKAARGPAWSPDGKELAFIAAQDGSFDLWLLTLEVSPEGFPRPAGEERLTYGAQVDATSRPSWAP
jgi:TolB protein